MERSDQREVARRAMRIRSALHQREAAGALSRDSWEMLASRESWMAAAMLWPRTPLAVLAARLGSHPFPERPVVRRPLIIALDTSTRMGGERERWSKALALALADRARQGHGPWAALTVPPDSWRFRLRDVRRLLDAPVRGECGLEPLADAALAVARDYGLEGGQVALIGAVRSAPPRRAPRSPGMQLRDRVRRLRLRIGVLLVADGADAEGVQQTARGCREWARRMTTVSQLTLEEGIRCGEALLEEWDE